MHKVEGRQIQVFI